MTWCFSLLAAVLLGGCAIQAGPISPAGPDEFVINFNHPTMTFETHGGKIVRFAPSVRSGETIAVRRRIEDGTVVFEGEYDGGNFIMTVTQSPCRDSITNREYPFEAFYTGHGLRTFGGCANLIDYRLGRIEIGAVQKNSSPRPP